MKKLVLFSLLSLCFSASAIKLDVDLDLDGCKIQSSAILNNSHVWQCQSGNIKMMVHIASEDDFVVMDFEILKKNEQGHFELISEPHIKTEWGKIATIELQRNNEKRLILQATATK